MPGLVPGIHVLLQRGRKDVDGRDEPGHDENDAQAASTQQQRRRALLRAALYG
jgi:hypothetical protein